MSSTLEQILRIIAEPSAESKMEVYRRSWLFPRIWVYMFKSDEDRIKSKKAINTLITYCSENNLNYIEIIADSLIEKYKLPSFILENMDKWMIAVRYLAYGNHDIEENLPKGDYQTAKDRTIAMIQNELKELLNS